jgi:radical SAM superfamily enzyme YgiQ (UPF0313 family)
MNVVLLSTYELGHQPFGLASPKAWLLREGHDVACADLSIESLPEAQVCAADLIAFYLPMHTATRLALPVIERVRKMNPRACLAGYGLYAPLNADLLRGMGVQAIVGGEFEPALVALARREMPAEIVLDRLHFITPDRRTLPGADKYARLWQGGESKQVAYTEASRGCKHLCRHCPIVPVYQGQFRVVQRDVVLADIRQQVAAGAQHVTFGDPDFFNGPSHARRIVEELHAEFPAVTYDATIKIEHLLKHRDLLPILKDTGCLFITSAAESLDDRVLAKLEKNHTRRDFFEAVARVREAGLTLKPTFIAFTPWTTLEGYRDLLQAIADLNLIENVAPVQLALRLLITPGSRLLELEDVRSVIGDFDSRSLVYPWKHPDPAVDSLGRRIFQLANEHLKLKRRHVETFKEIWTMAGGDPLPDSFGFLSRGAVPRDVPYDVPYVDEPWYCCAEPTEEQLALL